MPDQRNMLDQTKMTAPIPAVGAAGEQSQNKKSNDIIPKDRKNNNSLHTLSQGDLIQKGEPWLKQKEDSREPLKPCVACAGCLL